MGLVKYLNGYGVDSVSSGNTSKLVRMIIVLLLTGTQKTQKKLNNREIIRHAVEIALHHGLKIHTPKQGHTFVSRNITVDDIHIGIETTLKDNDGEFFCTFKESIDEFILSHKFAKAMWGEHSICKTCFEPGNTAKHYTGPCPDDLMGMIAWKYHLKEMVVQEDRPKYLEQFINDGEPTIEMLANMDHGEYELTDEAVERLL